MAYGLALTLASVLEDPSRSSVYQHDTLTTISSVRNPYELPSETFTT